MNDNITERARRHLPLWPDTDNPDHDLIADLSAEVEQLRTQLAERTDPELAARLSRASREMQDNDPFGWAQSIEACDAAARLLGGDR